MICVVIPPRTMISEGGVHLQRVRRASLRFRAGRRRGGHRASCCLSTCYGFKCAWGAFLRHAATDARASCSFRSSQAPRAKACCLAHFSSCCRALDAVVPNLGYRHFVVSRRGTTSVTPKRWTMASMKKFVEVTADDLQVVA